MLEVFAVWHVPVAWGHAGKAWIDEKIVKHGARLRTACDEGIVDALNEQRVILVCDDAAGLVMQHGARPLISLPTQRMDVATYLETVVEVYPLYSVLTYTSGVVVRTATIIIAETSY